MNKFGIGTLSLVLGAGLALGGACLATRNTAVANWVAKNICRVEAGEDKDSQIADLTKKTAELEKQCGEYVNKITELNTDIKSLNDRISELEGENPDSAELASLRTQLANKTQELETANSQLTEKSNQLDTINSQLTAKISEYNTLLSNYNTLVESNTQTQQDLNESLAQCTQLQSQIQSLQDTIEALQSSGSASNLTLEKSFNKGWINFATANGGATSLEHQLTDSFDDYQSMYAIPAADLYISGDVINFAVINVERYKHNTSSASADFETNRTWYEDGFEVKYYKNGTQVSSFDDLGITSWYTGYIPFNFMVDLTGENPILKINYIEFTGVYSGQTSYGTTSIDFDNHTLTINDNTVTLENLEVSFDGGLTIPEQEITQGLRIGLQFKNINTLTFFTDTLTRQ